MDSDTEEILSQEVNSETETQAVAKRIFSQLHSHEIILLIGGLGAGKTFLAQQLLQLWGVSEPITSPTFNLIHEFQVGDLHLTHADFYRLNHESELDDLDIYDDIFKIKPGGILIEWGERFPSLKRASTMEIIIEPYIESYSKMEGMRKIRAYRKKSYKKSSL